MAPHGITTENTTATDLAACAAAFAQDGFVVVPALLSADEVAELGSAVDGAVATRRASDDRSLVQRTAYEQSFQQCINLWEDFPEVRPLTFHSAVGAAAAALLGVDRVRLFHDQALYKEPAGRPTDAHQDQPYWPIHEPSTITAWIALSDVTMASGAVGYVPGSHQFGVRTFANIFWGEGLDLDAGPEARGVAPEFVTPKAGDVVFHHGLTIHTAGPNQTNDMRRAHTVIYFADGCHRGERPPRHPCVDRPGIKPGEPIVSSLTPIAWPRAAGDLPVAPPRHHPPEPGWPGWDWNDLPDYVTANQ